MGSSTSFSVIATLKNSSNHGRHKEQDEEPQV